MLFRSARSSADLAYEELQISDKVPELNDDRPVGS